MTNPADFDSLFGRVPWGFKLNEDGTRSYNAEGKALKILAASFLREMRALKSKGHDDAYIATFLAAHVVYDMVDQVREKGGRRGR